ncbi:MAG: hypothetical protein QXX79_02815 [Candidatus Bathyarchaeia archaeon]
MQRKKMLIAGLAMALLVGVVSAAVIQYFGQIQMTANVRQAMLLDGKDYTQMPITETATVAGGESFLRQHWLKSQTSVPVNLAFETGISPDSAGVTVSYLKSKGYKVTVKTKQYDTLTCYPINVTVEDVGDWIQWTFNFFAWNSTPMQGDGHFAGAVIISFDGVKPAFQIHDNDGVCSGFPSGTWLYSPYDLTGGGWYGWHTSEAAWNTKVEDIWWIEASGARDFVGNPEGKFIIKIHKTMLDATFYWAVYANQFGFYAPNNGYTCYPSGFLWGNEKFEAATILEEITSPFTLYPGQVLPFYIKYKFAVDIYPYTYTIYSTVKPAS